MKNIKGIYQDCDPLDTPQGSTFYTKNAVLTEGKGAIENEPGHLLRSEELGKQYIGSIELDKGDTLLFYINDAAIPFSISGI